MLAARDAVSIRARQSVRSVRRIAGHDVVEEEAGPDDRTAGRRTQNLNNSLAGIERPDLERDPLRDHAIGIEREQVELERAERLALPLTRGGRGASPLFSSLFNSIRIGLAPAAKNRRHREGQPRCAGITHEATADFLKRPDATRDPCLPRSAAVNVYQQFSRRGNEDMQFIIPTKNLMRSPGRTGQIRFKSITVGSKSV